MVSIDRRPIQAAPGSFVLGVAREAGIEIPTLCHHPALEPVGACRLCLVEVTHPDWGGWSGLMTACLYPVSDRLEISTRSPAVREARRRVLALLAARCPGSDAIRQLAARHGAKTDTLRVETDAADRCILCGLCTRVCENHATAAITTFGRGTAKEVGAFADRPPEDCVGCGACAELCPTGNIFAERTPSGYAIWQRSFDTAVCTVEEARCVGCAACVEACPFDVARVVLRAGVAPVATIPAQHCRGCGACVGACPSGAIDQDRCYDFATLLEACAPTREGLR